MNNEEALLYEFSRKVSLEISLEFFEHIENIYPGSIPRYERVKAINLCSLHIQSVMFDKIRDRQFMEDLIYWLKDEPL